MNKKLLVFVWIILGVLLFTACNLPSSPTPAAVDQSAEYTAAAETIAAQLTEVAPAVSETPAAAVITTEAPVVQASPTPTATTSASPTPTSTTEPTVTPASLPSPTFTPQANDPVASLGDPDWRDRFKTTSNWSLYEDDHANFDIDNNMLSMMAYNASGRDAWMLTWPQPEDFYLEATFQPQECAGLDRYGLIFRSDANNGYLAGITCDGQVSLRRWNGEKFKALIDWSPATPALVWANEPNRLGVMVVGDTFTLYVNGVEVAEASDDEYSEGGFGVFIGSKNTPDFQVDVLEISYWEIR